MVVFFQAAPVWSGIWKPKGHTRKTRRTRHPWWAPLHKRQMETQMQDLQSKSPLPQFHFYLGWGSPKMKPAKAQARNRSDERLTGANRGAKGDHVCGILHQQLLQPGSREKKSVKVVFKKITRSGCRCARVKVDGTICGEKGLTIPNCATPSMFYFYLV